MLLARRAMICSQHVSAPGLDIDVSSGKQRRMPAHKEFKSFCYYCSVAQPCTSATLLIGAHGHSRCVPSGADTYGDELNRLIIGATNSAGTGSICAMPSLAAIKIGVAEKLIHCKCFLHTSFPANDWIVKRINATHLCPYILSVVVNACT